MTVREVSRSELADRIPEVFSGRNTIAIVPHAADADWAAAVTWQFARAVAAEYRSVTLIDLSLEARALEPGSSVPSDEGIVDAFLYGSSLPHVTVSEPDTGLNFVSAGTSTSDPNEIWANPRWPQILEGLSRPHSIVIFFLPPEALDKLNVALDGVILAAPNGYDPRSATASQLVNRAIAGGIPLLHVVTGRATQPVAQETIAAIAAITPAVERAGRKAPWIYGALAVIAIASIWYGVFGGPETPAPETPALAPAESEPLPDRVGGAPLAAMPDAAAGAADTMTAFTVADSLFWGVQAASFTSGERAVEYVVQLDAGGFAAAVTPVRLSNGALWYRVVVGVEPDSAAADVLRAALWRTPLLREPDGQVVRTPWVLQADETPPGPIEETISGLRERGLSAYILPAADGAPGLFFGAFRTQDQARVADSILAASGIATTLVQRLGYNQ